MSETETTNMKGGKTKKSAPNYRDLAMNIAVSGAQGLLFGVSSALGARFISGIGAARVKGVSEMDSSSVVHIGSRSKVGTA